MRDAGIFKCDGMTICFLKGSYYGIMYSTILKLCMFEITFHKKCVVVSLTTYFIYRILANNIKNMLKVYMVYVVNDILREIVPLL